MKNKKKKLQEKYTYIEPIYNKNHKSKYEYSVLNQFICLECNKVNLVEELYRNKTELYAEKKIHCKCCKKNTTQICIRDKAITKAKLEITNNKAVREEKALQAIHGQRKQKCKKKAKKLSGPGGIR